MDVRVISLKSNSIGLRNVRRLYPEVRVSHGIDVRGVTLDSLVQSQIISMTAAHSISEGRKWHHELPTKGAVGIHQAMRHAISENELRHLLLFEEDVVIPDGNALRQAVDELLLHSHQFDIAVFGAIRQSGSVEDVKWAPGWFHCDDMFILLHCALYPSHSRARIAKLLELPQEAQVDALYSWWAKQGTLRIILHPGLARQSEHFSSIQMQCPLCDIRPHVISTKCLIITIVLICSATAALYWRRSKRMSSSARS